MESNIYETEERANGKDSRKNIVIRQTNRKMRGKEIKLGNLFK